MKLPTTSMHAAFQSDIFIFGCGTGNNLGDIDVATFFKGVLWNF